MATQVPNVLMLGVVAVQLGVVLHFLNRLVTGHWWVRPGSPSQHAPPARRLMAWTRSSGASTLSSRDLEGGQDASAAEAVQRFQWEALKVRAQGTVSRDTAPRLIDDAQILCEDLWAHEREVATRTSHAEH